MTDLQTFQQLCTAVANDEALAGLLAAEPQVCLAKVWKAVASFSTARDAAEWVAGTRFAERLASIATAAGALHDDTAREAVTEVFRHLAERYTTDEATTKPRTHDIRMFINRRTGERTLILHRDLDVLEDVWRSDDVEHVDATLVYDADPWTHGADTPDATAETGHELVKAAARLLEFGERVFNRFDCGLSIRGNRVKILGGHEDVPF